MKKKNIYILFICMILFGVTTFAYMPSEFDEDVSCVNEYLAETLERDKGIITETVTTKSLNHSTVFTMTDTEIKRVIQYKKHADFLEYQINQYDMLDSEKLIETEVNTSRGYQLVFDGLVIENNQIPKKEALTDFLDKSTFYIPKEDVINIEKNSTTEHNVYHIELEAKNNSVTNGVKLGYQYDEYAIDISNIVITIHVNKRNQQVESVVHKSQITYEIEGISDTSEKIVSYEFA